MGNTVLVIIFHLQQYLYYSERDTRQSCQLANTTVRRFLVRLCKSNNIFLICQII
mgnify:CR=1 FL=1